MTDHPIYTQFLEDFKSKKYPSHWPIELCAFTEFKALVKRLDSENSRLKERVELLEASLLFQRERNLKLYGEHVDFIPNKI